MTGLFLAVAALAQDEADAIPQDFAIDAERWRPPIDAYGYAITESSTTLKNLMVHVGVHGAYSEDSAVLVVDGERVIGPGPTFPDAMLDQKSVVDFQLGFGLAEVFGFVVDGPLVVWQSGFEPAAPESPVPTTDLVASGAGDLRVTPKFVVVDIHQGYPVGLALYATGTIPIGETRSLIGEGAPTVSPMVAFEVASGSVRDHDYIARGAVNVGARIKPPDAFRDVEYGSEFVYRAALSALSAEIFEVGVDLGGEVAGLRVPQAPVEILPWMRLHGFDMATLTAGAGFGLNPGLGSPDFRVFAGTTLRPSFDPLTLDRDGDGIPNKFDACINIPEDHDGFQDDDGCPDDDNDQDGVLDPDDPCPNDPEDVDGFQDQDGCPDHDNDRDGIHDLTDRCPMVPEDLDGWDDLDGCPDPDNDGDGFLDPQDACPNAAENFNGIQDGDGCPEDWIDTDGDGYHDELDRCPFDPEDFDRWQDEDGCPDVDNDLDGILDPVDQCPFDPETPNGYLDEDGCPDEAPSRVVVQREKIVISDKIFFEYNKAIIQELSFELLDEIARVMNDHPNVTLIQVEGHTDADGADTYNLKLSQARAQAVVDYLIRAGVESGRLVAKGFGESLPIDTNDSVEGKARNRRVEFTILERDEE